MALHSYLVFMCLTDKLNENCPQLWTKAWQKLLLQWFEIQRSSWHSSAPNVRPHSAAMHAAGRSHYLVPGLPASEVATRVNRNLKNVFMEIVDVSRLQRAEHIDNCKKRPRSAWNIVCLCGFFAFFLKEKWLGEDETAFLLKWQRLHSHSNVSVLLHLQLSGVCRLKAPSAPRAQTSIRNTTRGASAMASAEPLTPDFALSTHHTSERSNWLWWFLTCHHRSKGLLGIKRAFQPARLQVLSVQPENRFLRINTYSLSWCGCREKLT